MAGLGDLVGGFQGGVDWKQGVQRRQQQRRALEYGLQEEGMKQAGQRSAIDRQRSEAGLPPVNYGALQDPYAFNLANTIKTIFSPSYRAERRAAQAVPVDPRTYGRPGQIGGAARPSVMPADGVGPPAPYADGGTVEEELARRNAANRARYEAARAERGLSPSQIAERNPAAAAPRQGIARRAINSGAGRAITAGAGIAGAATGYNTPTDQYRERFNFQPSQREGIPRLIEDMGVRTLGVASDVGNALTGGLAGRYYRDLQDEGVTTPTPEEVAITEQVPAEEPMAITPPSPAAATPQQGALPSAPTEQGFDWSTVDVMPEDLPSMSTRDWVDYRKNAVADLMMQGMTERQANDEVTAMQHNGFMNQAQQAQMLMQAGNMPAAARALKAAYQYFPNGADVKFGIQGNALIGMGTDEETGEPTGKPMVLNEERLAATIANFQDPKNFLAWTKDWRDEAFKERKYRELDVPEAQSMADYRATTGKAALLNAQADQQRAINSASSGGQRSSDVANSEEFFRGELMMAGVPEEELGRLATVMAEIRVRVPQTRLSDSKILQDIMLAYENGQLDQITEQLGIR